MKTKIIDARKGKRRGKGALIFIVALISVFTLSACNASDIFFVYGTDLTVETEGLGGRELIGEIYDYIQSLEGILSPEIEGSDLYKINNAAENEPVVCSDATMRVMRTAQTVYSLSGGAYDPSVYPLVKLWGFDSGSFVQGMNSEPPAEDRIAEAKSQVGFGRAFSVDYENKTVTKNAGFGGAKLDFGGVAKGYAVSEALKLIGEKQKALINLGGNIGAGKSSYTIGIGHPRGADDVYYGKFRLEPGECVSTSGDYKRFYYYDGEVTDNETGEIIKVDRLHHIIDPSTGRPSGLLSGQSKSETLISVCVITPDGALGDALSTAVFVLGKTAGLELLNSPEIVEAGVKAVLINLNLDYFVTGELDFIKK